MAKFKNTRQQAVYDRYFHYPPDNTVHDGLAAAYRRGRDHDHTVLDQPPYERTSLAYAAWRAGHKTRAIVARYRPTITKE